MRFRQLVGAVVLVVLAALPAMATVCALVCEWPAAAHSPHGSHEDCAGTANGFAGQQINGTLAQCNNHDAVRSIAATGPQRAELEAAAARLALSTDRAPFSSPLLDVTASRATSPPGNTAVRKALPLVLRV